MFFLGILNSVGYACFDQNIFIHSEDFWSIITKSFSNQTNNMNRKKFYLYEMKIKQVLEALSGIVLSNRTCISFIQLQGQLPGR